MPNKLTVGFCTFCGSREIKRDADDKHFVCAGCGEKFRVMKSGAVKIDKVGWGKDIENRVKKIEDHIWEEQQPEPEPPAEPEDDEEDIL